MNLPWEYRPHALFICFAPYDNPKYAVSVVVEHGNAGADEAAPLAKLIMTDALLRDPASDVHPPASVAAPATEPAAENAQPTDTASAPAPQSTGQGQSAPGAPQ